MATSEKLLKLRAYYNSLLPTVTDESWQICESILTIRNLKKGDFLLKPGQVSNHVCFVNYGLLRLYHVVDGKEKIVRFCNELTYISDYQGFLTRQPSLVYIQAIEDCELVETSYDNMQMLYKEVPEANKLGRLIAEELFIDMCRRATIDINETIEQQYINLMDRQPWLLQRVPQYMIASYLGITPEALSRIKSRVSGKKLRLVPAN
jgi:CRP/FNR family transcriptional regulator, anaerobic regulatory protein